MLKCFAYSNLLWVSFSGRNVQKIIKLWYILNFRIFNRKNNTKIFCSQIWHYRNITTSWGAFFFGPKLTNLHGNKNCRKKAQYLISINWYEKFLKRNKKRWYWIKAIVIPDTFLSLPYFLWIGDNEPIRNICFFDWPIYYVTKF